jgi:hypothetical protein
MSLRADRTGDRQKTGDDHGSDGRTDHDSTAGCVTSVGHGISLRR